MCRETLFGLLLRASAAILRRYAVFQRNNCGRSQLLEASELLRGGKLFQKERKENRKREGNQ